MAKLIRDNIPADMRSRGYQPVLRNVTGKEKVAFLLRKLKEECGEVEECQGKELSELADVMEVLVWLAIENGHSYQALLDARAAKRDRRGAFGFGIVWENDDDQSEAALIARNGYAFTERSLAAPQVEEQPPSTQEDKRA